MFQHISAHFSTFQHTLEVLEWDKKNPAEDVRVKVKVKGSTDMGWVTRASADGMQYLKIQ